MGFHQTRALFSIGLGLDPSAQKKNLLNLQAFATLYPTFVFSLLKTNRNAQLLTLEYSRIAKETWKSIGNWWKITNVDITNLQEAITFAENAPVSATNKQFFDTGTSRSSILGEATINLADYADASQPAAISLPLVGSDHGTILHVSVWLLLKLDS
ncbi:hypothetical protein Tco_0236706, partial [Tanacetum coccineum]